MTLFFSKGFTMSTLQNKVNFLRSAENHQTITDFPTKAISISRNCLILLHKLCLLTVLFHKIIK